MRIESNLWMRLRPENPAPGSGGIVGSAPAHPVVCMLFKIRVRRRIKLSIHVSGKGRAFGLRLNWSRHEGRIVAFVRPAISCGPTGSLKAAVTEPSSYSEHRFFRGRFHNQNRPPGVKTGQYPAPEKNILRTWNKKGTFFSIGSPPIPVRRPWEAVCPAGESHT